MHLYALTLTAGETIAGTIVRASTVRDYLNAASNFLISVGKRKANPLTNPESNRQYDPIEKLLKDYQRWEDMPDRVEPLTKKMVLDLIKTSDATHEDSKQKAFVDWCILGLQMGYRRCEWAADRPCSNLMDFPRVPQSGEIYQALLHDFEFVGPGSEILDQSADHKIEAIGGVKIRIRYQKNGDNKQIITQAVNHDNPQLCCVRAVIRIKQRAKRLGLTDDWPASAYRANKGSRMPSFFHSYTITTLLKDMARVTYKIGPTDRVPRYTGHSFRVGATVILYVAGYDGPTIQMRIRWKSNSFLNYLRNVPQAAVAHVRALNATEVESFV